ncbi:MAG: tRNA-dihydrouridine synthase, partial [Pseudomonadota bacterium]
CQTHLETFDGVMLGRAAYQSPWLLSEVDRRLFGDTKAQPLTRAEVLQALRPYVERHLARGGRLHNILRHTLGLFQGQPGARAYRRFVSERAVGPEAGLAEFDEAIALVSRDHRLAETLA